MKFRFAFSALCMLVAMTMATECDCAGRRIQGNQRHRIQGPGHRPRREGWGHFSVHDRWEYRPHAGESGVVMIEYGVPITNAVGLLPTDGVVTDDNINIVVCSTANNPEDDRLVGDY